MITIQELAKIDNLVMKEIKVNQLSRIISKTDKGNLTIKIEKDEQEYKFFLDSIPLTKKTNAILLDLFDGILFDLAKEELKEIPINQTMDTTYIQQETPKINNESEVK